MKFVNGDVIFETTGRKEYCFGEGFSCRSDTPEVIYYGSDGSIGGFLNPLTHEERREAAGYMIAKWDEWLKAGEGDE